MMNEEWIKIADTQVWKCGKKKRVKDGLRKRKETN